MVSCAHFWSNQAEIVTAGEALVESEEPTLKAELEILHARIAELEARLATERFADRVRAEITSHGNGARARRTRDRDRSRRTPHRAQPQRWHLCGDETAGPAGTLSARGPANRLRAAQRARASCARRSGRTTSTSFVIGCAAPRSSSRSAWTRPCRREIIREVPAGRDDLPSKALGGAGGGALAVDPGDPHGTKTLQRVFQVDIELPEDVAAAAAFGSRAYVRFNHDWEPAGQQIWRRVRQLLLSRLQV